MHVDNKNHVGFGSCHASPYPRQQGPGTGSVSAWSLPPQNTAPQSKFGRQLSLSIFPFGGSLVEEFPSPPPPHLPESASSSRASFCSFVTVDALSLSPLSLKTPGAPVTIHNPSSLLGIRQIVCFKFTVVLKYKSRLSRTSLYASCCLLAAGGKAEYIIGIL